MPAPSPEIIQLLRTFATVMTTPTFQNALVLLFGTILTPGRRTVTAALRVLGLEYGAAFGKYHRVLSRARWSPMGCSRLLLQLIVGLLVPADAPVLLLIDETLERRRGKKIRYKGWFRDAVRSTANRVTVSQGIRWCCVCVLAEVPWSRRPWALPFLVAPVLSEQTCQKLGKRHRGTVGWATVVVERVRRWHPERQVILVGDGAYASVELIQQCQRGTKPVTLVTRLRLDASLYDFVGPQPTSKRGPKPKKGARQASLQERLLDPATVWRRVTLPWYGGQDKTLELATGVCLWYTPGHDPVPIRWVLTRCPEGSCLPIAYVCSNLQVAAEQILSWYLGRWNIEVTFEEVRAHLGFETQRHWSVAAICRTTPCLFGIFSLVVLMAKILHPAQLPLGQSSWYPKEEATFSDALAAVRLHLWSRFHYSGSPSAADLCLIPMALLQSLRNVACYAS
jgi:hypothetical protein